MPETPQWLLSKNKTKKARKSLCWLRGWVPAEAVAQEFQHLQHHGERSKACDSCIQQDVKCSHLPPTFCEKLSNLKEKSILRPFLIIVLLFVFAQFNGYTAMRPYILQLLKSYDCPIPYDQAATFLSVCDFFAVICLLSSIRFAYLTMADGCVYNLFVVDKVCW